MILEMYKLSSHDILYEDNHLLVVRKAPGILSQEDKSGKPDILNLSKDFIKSRDQKPGNVFMGLVHRLDRNTGGVICLAKTSKAASRLSEQIRKQRWEKYYLALAPSGNLGDDWTVWSDTLSKDSISNRSEVLLNGEGKASVLQIKEVNKVKYQDKHYSLYLVHLKTGRSHQIRVQMASRDLPLIGDSKYGGIKLEKHRSYFLGLWAYGLKIFHPITQEEMYFTDLPNGFPWELFTQDVAWPVL